MFNIFAENYFMYSCFVHVYFSILCLFLMNHQHKEQKLHAMSLLRPPCFCFYDLRRSVSRSSFLIRFHIEWLSDFVEWLPDFIEWLPDFMEWIQDFIEWLPDLIEWLQDFMEWLPDFIEWLLDFI